ncbi:MAG TPA: MGMT family protein [Xanthomonadales bacterium]|nr:MGMT family protein [Xanthomonadales bacterium]
MTGNLSRAAQSILATVRRVPRGRVASYGQVAAEAGLKGRARLVGWALRHAPSDDTPWWRILRADGSLAFPKGSAPFAEQSRRLARERVVVAGGRVDLARHGWKRSLDEQLWGPSISDAATRRRR